jgi:hypothetical protein
MMAKLLPIRNWRKSLNPATTRWYNRSYLTAVVIGFGSFSMLLSMINVIARRYQTLDSDKIDHLKG